MLEIVTLGETMLRFTPPAQRRLEQADQFEVHIGGSESNTAVGLARLGNRVAWISRLTDNALGRMISRGIQHHGVDVSHVIWTDEDRVGVYYLEEGKAPRGSQVIYDRKHSAMSRLQAGDLPVALFAPGNARLFHTTGITLALSRSAASAVERAMDLARHAGWLVSFDVNYRAKLWSADEAREACEGIIQQADVVFIALRDARLFYGLDDHVPAEDVLRALAARFPRTKLVMTMSSQGAMAYDGIQFFQQAAFSAEPIGRLGGGDAFSAGFLHHYLRHEDVGVALRWGAAVAALKYSIPGDLPLVEPSEVQRLVESGGTSGLTR